jgi:heat shock protein HslJ
MFKSLLRAASIPLAALTLFAAPAIAEARVVHLQSQQNGSYVCFHGTYLSARCDQARALPIEIVSLGNGMVALRNMQTGGYIRAGLTQGTLLGGNSAQIGAWERFQMQDWNGATYFRSPQANAFVRAGIGQDTLLGATSPHMRGWEAFNLVQPASSQRAAAPRPGAAVTPVAFRGRWQLDQLMTARGGHQPLEGIRPDENMISIDPNGSIIFSLGCNRVNGILIQRGEDEISAGGAFFTTRRGAAACSNSAFNLEQTLLDTLEQAERFAVRGGGRFVISGRDGSFIQMRRL